MGFTEKGSMTPEQLNDYFKKRFFGKELEISPKFVEEFDGEQDQGSIAKVMCISSKSPVWRGSVLKIFTHPKTDRLGCFSRNIAVLQQLVPLYIEKIQTPEIPYVLASGTYQGQPACIETRVPHLYGAELDTFIKRQDPQIIRKFCVNTLGILSRVESQGVVQIEPKEDNLGFNPETGQVNMIDFGNCYSEETKLWTVNMDRREALKSGLETYRDLANKVLDGLTEASTFIDAVNSLAASSRINSYFDAFIAVKQIPLQT